MECWGCRLATRTPARTCCTAAPEVQNTTQRQSRGCGVNPLPKVAFNRFCQYSLSGSGRWALASRQIAVDRQTAEGGGVQSGTLQREHHHSTRSQSAARARCIPLSAISGILTRAASARGEIRTCPSNLRISSWAFVFIIIICICCVDVNFTGFPG